MPPRGVGYVTIWIVSACDNRISEERHLVGTITKIYFFKELPLIENLHRRELALQMMGHQNLY